MRQRKTTLNPQPWPWPWPRVLVEHPDEAAGMALASSLREAGYAVAVCPGPEHAERCPLTGPEGCAAAHGADVIVSSLGTKSTEAREVLEALRARCPDTPLIVEVATAEDAESDLPADCEFIVSPLSRERLVAVVDGALAKRRAR